MQEYAVQVVRLQVPQRGRNRLADLVRLRRSSVVGNSVRVLAGYGREFRLQVDIGALQALPESGGDTRPDPGLVVVFGLTGRVDAAKAAANGEAYELRRGRFLPGGAVNDSGDRSHASDRAKGRCSHGTAGALRGRCRSDVRRVCASAQTRSLVIAHDDENTPGMEIHNELEQQARHSWSSIVARAVLRRGCCRPAHPAPRVPARADRPAYRALDAGASAGGC